MPTLPAILSFPIHKHAPLYPQAVSIHPWRSFCHSADCIPGYSKCSDFNTAVFEGQEKSRSSYFSAPLTPPDTLIFIYTF